MIGTKICTTCSVRKPVYCFYKRASSSDGLMSECKDCNNARRKARYYANIDVERANRIKYYNDNKTSVAEWRKEYYERNKDLLAARHKAYHEGHKNEIAAHAKSKREQHIDAFRESRREYYAKNKDRINAKAKIYREKYKEKRREYGRRYREENKNKINQKKTERLHGDPVFKLKEQSRNMLRCSFMTRKHHKNNHFFDIVGCSADELTARLKKTWLDRYGHEWNGEPCHIDHIVPLATADTYEEVVKLCHYTNLQLLTPEDNLSKSDKLQNRPT